MLIEHTYRKMIADGIRPNRSASVTLTESDDLLSALMSLVEALQTLETRHEVGGGIASSFLFATRSTMGVDPVAELDEASVFNFIEENA